MRKKNQENQNMYVSHENIRFSSSSPQAIFSPSSYLTGHTISCQVPPEHPPPPPPPLPPLPHQAYNSVTTDSTLNSNHSVRRPHYDEVITRESLQYRVQRLRMEEEAGEENNNNINNNNNDDDDEHRQQQQIRENYYSSVNSERGTMTGSDLYAEIANGSASGTVHQHVTSHYYSRPLTGSVLGDDLSERYATVIESIEPTLSSSNRIYQEVDTLKL
jgi:hypothetical protein